MPDRLRLLVVEDSEDDELLLARELMRAGYVLDTRRVWTAAALEEALAAEWDLVISDWSMPELDGLAAFRIVRRHHLDLPFIIVSGTIDEEVAVEALRAGVDDFMTKGRFARLVPAMERARREAATKRRQREADRLLEQERRESEARLMVSDRMASVGMLAAGVAHEINNPLAAVLSNLELMSSLVGPTGVSASDAAEVREMLDDALAAADRVRHIVRDLKIFSRHEESDDGAVDVKRTLQSTCRMAWNEIRHRARLVTEYADTPLVRGSESRLGQVFLNLLVNAAQAIPPGDVEHNTIRVTTAAAGDRVTITISDTGAGMAEDTIRKIFTPFFTTKPQGEGTGLGLAIVYRLVTGLGGTIDVDSAVGRGTTFRVVLPTAVAVSAPAPAIAPSTGPVRRGRILVVDDEPVICTAIRRTLSRQHDVETTTRATEALERIRAGEVFDVIVCDLMMPQMTGMELHAQLAALGLADRMIFLTGGAFTAAAREFLARVTNPCVEKPFDQRQLAQLVGERVRDLGPIPSPR